ncbi:ParA family protein [uncultured Brachyspira sp.]|jgi:chromosome partitioning protein|uniref:ParA family protein n=1 Tax=uncultured Brachyspira sp. TaxID=221953 RepID=UPI00263775A1|nr:ParA family protein [uncultured Brachyspira sp.]
MILTVANQKGGVGKTTFLVNYAYYLNEKQSKSVCVIDLDTQANCTLVLSKENKIDTAYNLFKENINMKEFSKDKINLYYSEINLLDEEEYNKEIYLNNLKHLNKIYDCVLIDTAPVVSNRLIYSLQVSDYVITPIELEVFSLQGLELMLNTIFNIKQEYNNNNMVFLGVLPSRVNTTNPRQLKALEDLKEEYGEDLFLPYIKNRNDIANALANQQSIFKSKSKHKKELLDVFDYIYNKTI